MSMQDPISDMITRIRNGLSSSKKIVTVASSNQKEAILKILVSEGYIQDYSIDGDKKKMITVTLKYYENKPVITLIQRLSKPGLRLYKSVSELASDFSSVLDTVIVSTSRGVMTASQARKLNLGGEILVRVK
jgi:small subunit ribosomal protein S8